MEDVAWQYILEQLWKCCSTYVWWLFWGRYNWVYVWESKSSHGVWMYWQSMHNPQCEKEQCTTPKRLANIWEVEVPKPKLNISQKNSQVCCLTTSSFQHFSAWLNTPQEGSWRSTSIPLASPTLAHNLATTNYFLHMTDIMFFCTFDIFLVFVVRFMLYYTNH